MHFADCIFARSIRTLRLPAHSFDSTSSSSRHGSRSFIKSFVSLAGLAIAGFAVPPVALPLAIRTTRSTVASLSSSYRTAGAVSTSSRSAIADSCVGGKSVDVPRTNDVITKSREEGE